MLAGGIAGEPTWQRRARERAEFHYEFEKYLHEQGAKERDQENVAPQEWITAMRNVGRL
jgi:hypothetical protein